MRGMTKRDCPNRGGCPNTKVSDSIDDKSDGADMTNWEHKIAIFHPEFYYISLFWFLKSGLASHVYAYISYPKLVATR